MWHNQIIDWPCHCHQLSLSCPVKANILISYMVVASSGPMPIETRKNKASLYIQACLDSPLTDLEKQACGYRGHPKLNIFEAWCVPRAEKYLFRLAIGLPKSMWNSTNTYILYICVENGLSEELGFLPVRDLPTGENPLPQGSRRRSTISKNFIVIVSSKPRATLDDMAAQYAGGTTRHGKIN